MDIQRGLEGKVESFLARRIGRECIFMPSGRVALFCALRVLLTPGDRILMSPVNDDVIFFVVLAAGLRPVAAPLSAEDGNIDPQLIPPQTWSEIRAVLTTNLYGLPDRMAELRERCDAHGLVLIEDVAHAIETEVNGVPLGTFGAAAAFSLSKHVDAYRGGVLAVADPHMRGEIERIREEIMTERSISRRVADVAKPPIKALLEAAGVMGRIRKARVAAVERYVERGPGAHRMDLRPDALRRAISGGPDLEAFDSWVRVDRHDYQTRPGTPDFRRMLERLDELDRDRERRARGVELLCNEFDFLTPRARNRPYLPLFRVPLLVADRESAMAALAKSGVLVRYIYDPPLDDYAGPEFMAPSSNPDAARWWVRHALPIDPLRAVEALPVLHGVTAASYGA